MTNSDNLWKTNTIPPRLQRSRKQKLRKTKRLFHLLFILRRGFSLGWQNRECLLLSVCVSVVCRPVQKPGAPMTLVILSHRMTPDAVPQTPPIQSRVRGDGWTDGRSRREIQREKWERKWKCECQRKRDRATKRGRRVSKEPGFPLRLPDKDW